MLLRCSQSLSISLSLSLSELVGRGAGGPSVAAAAVAAHSAHSSQSWEKSGRRLSSSVTLAHRLTVKTATERSHAKPQERVKVGRGSLWDFCAWKYNNKRGSRIMLPPPTGTFL
ncbi:Hypothetical predicted protein [Xyrichtys novacula]|uniref:Secreted protein n=1 Tax=Xyrichtys novacula TaxID=13765 RepID=A0AAV1H5M4_XYRNO|nr:Hypothetical predicted protein [Xyrichtys novacula]